MHNLIKSAVCPFFLNASNFSLKCEGFENAVSMRLCFDGKEHMKEHTDKYCTDMNGYPMCPLYPVIMKQYKEECDE